MRNQAPPPTLQTPDQAPPAPDRKRAISAAKSTPGKASTAAPDCRRTTARQEVAQATPVNKQAHLLALIQRPEGATFADLILSTGWQAHSIRGAISTLRKKQGLRIRLAANPEGVHAYRIEA